MQNLELQLPVIDSNKYLAKIANKAKVSEKTYRSALGMLSAIKNDPISHGKDPNALAVAGTIRSMYKRRRECQSSSNRSFR